MSYVCVLPNSALNRHVIPSLHPDTGLHTLLRLTGEELDRKGSAQASWLNHWVALSPRSPGIFSVSQRSRYDILCSTHLHRSSFSIMMRGYPKYIYSPHLKCVCKASGRCCCYFQVHLRLSLILRCDYLSIISSHTNTVPNISFMVKIRNKIYSMLWFHT